MNTLGFAILLSVGTTANLIVSWRVSIKGGRYHGIYRFFSFESILVLVLLCAPVWFADPWKWNQLISWGMLVGSIPLPAYGFQALHAAGKPVGQFENTTTLVTTGIYRYIRHPLYVSLMLVGTGIFFKDISQTTAFCAMVNLLALIATARAEEREMLKKFGDEYAQYMQHTKMFVPFVV
ncbi:MAG TPA: isoprenylcysteine carboxylmethyltransferase family protein [Bacteroidota bacterium]|nr:isoprenylcysteine carboxylmethyltransferase family protein [Bacteroidota bacterium]